MRHPTSREPLHVDAVRARQARVNCHCSINRALCHCGVGRRTRQSVAAARRGCLKTGDGTGFQPFVSMGPNPGASPHADIDRAFGPQNRIRISMLSAESASPYQPGARPQDLQAEWKPRAEGPLNRGLRQPRQARPHEPDPNSPVREGTAYAMAWRPHMHRRPSIQGLQKAACQ